MKPLPATMRRALAGLATIGRSQAVRAKLQDMLGGNGSLRSLYLHRRRVMSDSQLSHLGLAAADLGLDADFLTPAAAPDVDSDANDPIRVVSQLEFRLYQGNMLLRDTDVNGMAFGMELRVPFLDQRVLDLIHALPGPVRLPPRTKNKHLLRLAFPDLLRPSTLRIQKRGFSLPISRWMAGSMRPMCEAALADLKDARILKAVGINSVWNRFLSEPNSPMWSRAFALVVLGHFCRTHSINA
jgi:asparagine synthase (glutamine-hydrolysing)